MSALIEALAGNIEKLYGPTNEDESDMFPSSERPRLLVRRKIIFVTLVAGGFFGLSACTSHPTVNIKSTASYRAGYAEGLVLGATPKSRPFCTSTGATACTGQHGFPLNDCDVEWLNHTNYNENEFDAGCVVSDKKVLAEGGSSSGPVAKTVVPLPASPTTSPVTQSIGNEPPSSATPPLLGSTGLPEATPSTTTSTTTTSTTIPCISGVPTITANVANTPVPGTSGQYLGDVSGIITNSSTSPIYVSFVFYSVEYGNGPTGITDQSPEIDATVPVGGSVAWDSGSIPSYAMATGATARIIFSFTDSGASC